MPVFDKYVCIVCGTHFKHRRDWKWYGCYNCPPKSLEDKVKAALTPELLKPEYRVPGAHHLYGHCYVASEAMYHLEAKAKGFKPHSVRVGQVVHWYLEHTDGRRIDLTSEQFPFPMDYAKGRGRGFLTREPSKRTRIVMAKVRG
jgi:hypothetical protein